MACLAIPVQAASLEVCISDEAFPPFTFPNREGNSQRLIRQAVERQGWQLEFVALPWRRCLAGVEQGIFGAIAGVAANPEYLDFMAFPQRLGQADPQRAVGITRLVVYRLSGGAAAWDGRVFSGLGRPVLYLSGRTTLKVLLEGLGVSGVDTARTSTQLAHMLLRGRGSLAIDHDYQVELLLAEPEFRGRFEVLPAPLGEAPIFLAVGRQLYQRNSRQVEAIWNEIGVLRRATGPTLRPLWQVGSSPEAVGEE
ncbi:substrate-binding periplasmic protein [Pseudomonas zhanjiangensis]|uniref:Substrate-binding periplasmic protein n=1 Tax=Pseudomonas zhanjiangensis TaxID=3239015 RepID=A0ABV3YZ10_9PSED